MISSARAATVGSTAVDPVVGTTVPTVTRPVGVVVAATGTDTPDRLSVALDKPAYRIGDTARVTLEAAADGVAVVSVLSNRVIDLKAVPVTAGTNTVDLPVTEDWGANAYVAVSAIRPVAAGTGELSRHTPVRSLGIAAAGALLTVALAGCSGTAAGSAPRTTSVVMRSCAPRLNSAAEAVSTFVTEAGVFALFSSAV